MDDGYTMSDTYCIYVGAVEEYVIKGYEVGNDKGRVVYLRGG